MDAPFFDIYLKDCEIVNISTSTKIFKLKIINFQKLKN